VSPRVLEPEWLDELPAGDLRAIRSRADLRRVNAVMGNARLIAGQLRNLLPGDQALQIADLGTGDGALALAVAQRLARPRVRLTLVDRAPVVHGITLERLSALGWRGAVAASDVFDFLARPGERFDAVFVNLFLHHFDDQRLARLLALIAARTRVFVACEPRRSGLALTGSRLLWALGCNDVTRHDAVASVRAGFSAAEVSALWPERERWRIDERAAFPFSHLFTACAATRS
jgi:SAM-dependent methyltransferase